MTNQQHPITPPLALIDQWWDEAKQNAKYDEPIGPLVATQAAQWGADQQLKLDAEQINQAWQKGADQELEACCEWLDHNSPSIGAFHLRIDRRPKPPSLAKRALHILGTHGDLSCAEHDTIRRALEQLDD